MVNEYDVDGNGKIDFGEFCKMMKEMNKETDQELIRLAFKYVFVPLQKLRGDYAARLKSPPWRAFDEWMSRAMSCKRLLLSLRVKLRTSFCALSVR